MKSDKDVKVLWMICFTKQQIVIYYLFLEVRESTFFAPMKDFSESKNENDKANQVQKILEDNAFDMSGANEEKCNDSLDYNHHIIIDDANQIKNETPQQSNFIANNENSKQEENAFIINENVNNEDVNKKTIQSQETISSTKNKNSSKWNREDFLNKINKLKKVNTVLNAGTNAEKEKQKTDQPIFTSDKKISEEQSRNYRSASKDFTNEILSSFKKEKDTLNDFPQKKVIPIESISNNMNERIKSRASIFTEDILKGLDTKPRNSFI